MPISAIQTKKDIALRAIAQLSSQVEKASGLKRQKLLDEIKAQQDIVTAYDKEISDTKKAKDRAKIQSKINAAQAELDVATARGIDTTNYQSKVDEYKALLNPVDPSLLKDSPFQPVAPGEQKIAGPVAVTPSTTVPPKTGGSTGTITPTVDTKQLWVDYLTKTFRTLENPAQKMQIDNLFTKAKAGKWTEATFMEALQGTDWWQQTLPSMRSFFIETNDPRNQSTFAQKMLNQTDYVQQQMEKLGIAVRSIDPVTGKVIDNTSMVQGIAMEAIQNGWSDAQLQEHLATKSEIIFTGGGAIGSYVDQLKNQALKYGVNLDKNQLSYMQRDLLNPADGKDAQYYLNSIKQQSIDANPWFAASLKEGRTLYDVTSTYRNQMATLLEVAPENITWNDLMNKVVNKDKNAASTFADFTKSVKQDPLWQYTRNAKETYSNMAVDLMKQFGFMG
jgi:hypothetical protein